VSRQRRRLPNAVPHKHARATLVALLAACFTTVLATTASARVIVTVDGVRGMRPGMSESAVERALGVSLRINYLRPSCGTASFRVGTTKGYAMFSGPRFASLWFQGGARTGRGIHIGSTLNELHDAYLKLRSRPDYYIPNERNFFYRRPSAPHWRLRFDVSPEGRVNSIAFGNESVFLVPPPGGPPCFLGARRL
jgi:hypothetical protein